MLLPGVKTALAAPVPIAGRHGTGPELREVLGHKVGRPGLLLAEFGVLMDIAPPGDQFVLDLCRPGADLLLEVRNRNLCLGRGWLPAL
jgi:hypothetical protein